MKEEHMMHLNSVNNGMVDLTKIDGIISEKQSSILSVTKVVVALSVFLAILMVVLK
jgi:hypothetical protein